MNKFIIVWASKREHSFSFINPRGPNFSFKLCLYTLAIHPLKDVLVKKYYANLSWHFSIAVEPSILFHILEYLSVL